MHIDLQIASSLENIPSLEQLERWVEATLLKYKNKNSIKEWNAKEMTIRIVDREESAELNKAYRKKMGPTNVLSFPFSAPEITGINLLGDIILCAPVVEDEAKEQHKEILEHWAHLVIHGCLHLLGYDHQTDAEAHEMETLEIEIMQYLNLPNPYEETKE